MSDKDKNKASNDRQRKLLIAFAVVVVASIGFFYVYPRLLKPWLDVGGQIEKEKKERSRLIAALKEAESQRARYRTYVKRTADVDANRVKDVVNKRLTDILEEAGLPGGKVDPQQQPARDHKTNVQSIDFTVAADTTLDRAVDFLRRCYELPYLMAIESVTLSPTSGGAKNKKSDQVHMTAKVQVKVLPQNATVGLIDLTDLDPPESHVRHRTVDFGPIAMRQPFNEWMPPPEPPKPIPPPPQKGACCLPGDSDAWVCVQETLEWCGSHGGSFKGEHSPCEPMPCPKKVEIVEATNGGEPPPPPPPPPLARDPLGQFKLVAATLSYGIDEIRVQNSQAQGHEYLSLGADVDGGKLTLVHPLAAVVSRPDGDFVYPLGKTFDQSVSIAMAHDYPEIQIEWKRMQSPPPPEEPAAAELNAEQPYDGVASDDVGNGTVSEDSFEGPPPRTEPMTPPAAEADEQPELQPPSTESDPNRGLDIPTSSAEAVPETVEMDPRAGVGVPAGLSGEQPLKTAPDTAETPDADDRAAVRTRAEQQAEAAPATEAPSAERETAPHAMNDGSGAPSAMEKANADEFIGPPNRTHAAQIRNIDRAMRRIPASPPKRANERRRPSMTPGAPRPRPERNSGTRPNRGDAPTPPR